MDGLRIQHNLSQSEILFLRIRDTAMKEQYRSERFIEWVKSRSPYTDPEFHRLAGIRSTDLLGVALTSEAQRIAGTRRDFNISKVTEALQNLFGYVKLIESK